MANLGETEIWEPEIYQLETADAIQGGAPDQAQGRGLTNLPPLQLANRTRMLKSHLDLLLEVVGGDVNYAAKIRAAAEGSVPLPREVAAGDGVSGGGILNQHRTFAVEFASVAEAEAGTNAVKAMSPFLVGKAYDAQVGDLATGVVPLARSISGGVGISGGGDLSQNRTYSADFASQQEAEDGTSSAKVMSPLRMRQAFVSQIGALTNSLVNEARRVSAGVGLDGGGSLASNRSLAAVFASKAEAEAGVNSSKAISPKHFADLHSIERVAFGVGQSWEAVRVNAGVVGQNTSGVPISIMFEDAPYFMEFEVSADGASWLRLSVPYPYLGMIVIPDGHYYRLIGSSSNHMKRLA